MALPSQQRVPSRSTLLRPSMEGTSKSPSKPRWLMWGIVAVVLVLVVVFAAAKRYQAANGRWPTSLNELASQSGPAAVKAQPTQAQTPAGHHAMQDGAMILRNVSTSPKAHSASTQDDIGAAYQPGVNIPLVTSSTRDGASGAATPAASPVNR